MVSTLIYEKLRLIETTNSYSFFCYFCVANANGITFESLLSLLPTAGFCYANLPSIGFLRVSEKRENRKVESSLTHFLWYRFKSRYLLNRPWPM